MQEGARIVRVAQAAGISLWEVADMLQVPYSSLRYRLKRGAGLNPVRQVLKMLIKRKRDELEALVNELEGQLTE